MAFPSNYYIDCVLKYMYNIKNGIKDCDPRIINDATEWLVDNEDAFIKYYNQTDSVRETIQMILDDENHVIDMADANISVHGNKISESMKLSEAIDILSENGYILEEGLFSDIKDKVINKVKNYFSYNEWCREVKQILKDRFRITIDELKTVINLNAFKKCYEQSIKPINFVKGLMKKYKEIMNQRVIDEDPYVYYSYTPEKSYQIAEAYKIIDKYLIDNSSSESIKSNTELNESIKLLKNKGYIIEHNRHNI